MCGKATLQRNVCRDGHYKRLEELQRNTFYGFVGYLDCQELTIILEKMNALLTAINSSWCFHSFFFTCLTKEKIPTAFGELQMDIKTILEIFYGACQGLDSTIGIGFMLFS